MELNELHRSKPHAILLQVGWIINHVLEARLKRNDVGENPVWKRQAYVNVFFSR